MEEKQRTLTWTIEGEAPNTTVVFEGEINETFLYDKLADALSDRGGALTFDLAAIRRLNSVGVRQWVNFMRTLAEVDEIGDITFSRCSIAVISQVNMIHDFLGRAKIISFYAPYAHSESGEEEERLLEVKDITDPLDPPTFKDDEGEWEFDEMPERYFEFMRV